MSVEVWGLMPKSQVDPEKVEEAISRIVQQHNNDPTSHLAEGQSLTSHRASEIIDHRAESVVNDKLLYMTRPFSFIVSLDGNGDYTDIQEAIDAAVLRGGGRILIKAGIYQQSANINLYSNIELVGDDDETSIIDFNHTAYGIRLIGTSGQHIRNVELSEIQVRNLNGEECKAFEMDYVDGFYMHDCILQDVEYGNDLYGYGFHLNHVTDFRLQHNKFTRVMSLIYFVTGLRVDIIDNFIEYCEGEVFWVNGGNYYNVDSNRCEHLQAPFFYTDQAINWVRITRNVCPSTGYQAVYVEGAESLLITDNYFYRAVGTGSGIYLRDCIGVICTQNYIFDYVQDGIFLYNCDDSIFSENRVYSCDRYGINVSNANCQRNIVTSNQLRNNLAPGLYDVGTSTVKANNVTS